MSVKDNIKSYVLDEAQHSFFDTLCGLSHMKYQEKKLRSHLRHLEDLERRLKAKGANLK